MKHIRIPKTSPNPQAPPPINTKFLPANPNTSSFEWYKEIIPVTYNTTYIRRTQHACRHHLFSRNHHYFLISGMKGCSCGCKKKPSHFQRPPDIPEGDWFCKVKPQACGDITANLYDFLGRNVVVCLCLCVCVCVGEMGGACSCARILSPSRSSSWRIWAHGCLVSA